MLSCALSPSLNENGPLATFASTTEVYTSFDHNVSVIYLLFFFLAVRLVGILVPRPGMEPGPPAVEARSPNHWTSREFPDLFVYISVYPHQTEDFYRAVPLSYLF